MRFTFFTDMNFFDTSKLNDTALVNITCNLMYPHFEWTDVTITSLNSSISANLMRNGTYDISPSNGSTVYTLITNDRVILSISFSDSPNITCLMSGFYICNLKRNTSVLASKSVEISMIGTCIFIFNINVLPCKVSFFTYVFKNKLNSIAKYQQPKIIR